MDVDQLIQEDALRSLARQQRDARRARWMAAALLLVVSLGVIGGVYRQKLLAVLAPRPPAYSAELHRKKFIQLMTHRLPDYVVAASDDDAPARTRAEARLLKACAFYAGLSTHCENVLDAVRQAQERLERTLLSQREVVREQVANVTEALDGFSNHLRRGGVPFDLDDDVGAVTQEQKWRLRFVLTTAEITGEFHFRAGDQTFVVQQMRRLDHLNVMDLVHGKARRGVARVLEEDASATVALRYLPALGTNGTFRDFQKDQAPWEQALEEPMKGLARHLPQDLWPHVDTISDLAGERRAALEALADVLKQRNAVLIPPARFMLTRAWLKDMARYLRKDQDGTLGWLKRFSVDSDLPAETRDRLELAHAALLRLFMQGVARHEAWHLHNMEPTASGVEAGVAAELYAFSGGLADAEDGEQTLVLDHISRLAREGTASDTHDAVTMLLKNLPTAAADNNSGWAGVRQAWFGPLPRMQRVDAQAIPTNADPGEAVDDEKPAEE